MLRPSSGPVLAGEVLVLHLPRMVERVEGGVSDEEWQRPRSACAARPRRRCRRASPRHRSPDAAAAHPGSAPLPPGSRNPTCFAKSSLSLRMTWRMIRSRSRPPPRGPLRISGETRAATPSKNAQHARNSVIARSSSASPIGPMLGRRWREGDAPEVGRTGTDPVLDDLERPGGVELARHPGEVRDRPIALPIGLERLQGELGGLRAPAPARPVEAKATDRLSLVPCSMTVRTGMAQYSTGPKRPARTSAQRGSGFGPVAVTNFWVTQSSTWWNPSSNRPRSSSTDARSESR